MPSTPNRGSTLTVVASPVKSTKKINNLTSSLTRTSISNLPPQVPTYRSVVIEKHSNFTDENVKSNTSKVKYAPPGQPATVLNTVINTLN